MCKVNPIGIDSMTEFLTWVQSRLGFVLHEEDVPCVFGPVLVAARGLYTVYLHENGGFVLDLTVAGRKWLH